MLWKCIEPFDATTGFTVLGNDTDNLATTTRRVRGVAALEFDKVNGAANTVNAGAYKTIDAKLDEFPASFMLEWWVYCSTLVDVDFAWIRLGTSASHYVEYRVPANDMTAGQFSRCLVPLGGFQSVTGNGCEFSNVDYLAVGVAFNGEANTLADIAVDRLSIIAAVTEV
jgi:hypothetical protein